MSTRSESPLNKAPSATEPLLTEELPLDFAKETRREEFEQHVEHEAKKAPPFKPEAFQKGTEKALNRQQARAWDFSQPAATRSASCEAATEADAGQGMSTLRVARTFALSHEELAKSRFYGMGFLLVVLAGLSLFLFDAIPEGVSRWQLPHYLIAQTKPEVQIYWSAIDKNQPIKIDAELMDVPDTAQSQDGQRVREGRIKEPGKDVNKAQTQTEPLTSSAQDGFVIQVLATTQQEGAQEALEAMAQLGYPVQLVQIKKTSTVLWRVRLGVFTQEAQALAAQKQLDALRIEHMPVQRVDRAQVLVQLGDKN